MLAFTLVAALAAQASFGMAARINKRAVDYYNPAANGKRYALHSRVCADYLVFR